MSRQSMSPFSDSFFDQFFSPRKYIASHEGKGTKEEPWVIKRTVTSVETVHAYNDEHGYHEIIQKNKEG